MSLALSKMESELLNLGLYGTEVDAINVWSLAYYNFMSDAVTGGVPINTTNLVGAQSVMATAMAGLSSIPHTSIKNGITAFWEFMAATPGTIFTGAIELSAPTTLSLIEVQLGVVFGNNLATSASKEDAAADVATVMYNNSLGGMATFPGAPPVVVPIL